MKTVAVIGFGCAGYSAARAVRLACPDSVIHIYSDTDEAPYNPMLTTYYVSGKISEGEMFPLGDLDAVSRELRAEIFCSSPVKKLEARERRIILGDGSSRTYDDIVVASGASAVIPPIKNLPKEGIYTMRTASDARRLERALAEKGVKSALVVGAQMVGIKVAELLLKRGIKTVLADMESKMFPASAYDSTAGVIARRLERAGMELRLGSAVDSIVEKEGRLESSFAGGGRLESDIVVFCSGIRPNLSFVDRDEVEVGLGIKTNSRMESSVPHVYAAGDCCEARDVLGSENVYIGLWANSAMQGRVAGNSIAGVPDEYRGNLVHNITHYMDTDFISVGNVKACGERVFWEKPDGGWRIEATVAEGKIAALNILDNAGISGPVKNVLLHLAAHPGSGMSDSAKLILARSGIPADVIKKLGGEK